MSPELLDIMRSVRCVSCAELGRDEEGFGFVPTSEQEGDGSVGLTALCARHLPVFVRKLRPGSRRCGGTLRSRGHESVHAEQRQAQRRSG